MDLELSKLPELSDISNLNLNTNDPNEMDMDSSWIQSYETDDKKYSHFYKEEVASINYFCIYIDANNTIIKIKKDKLYLENNTISKDQLFYILQKNSRDERTKFKLSTILKYNITLDPENILKFINSKQHQTSPEYLHPISSIDTITYQDTINIFQELNALFIIYNIKTLTTSKNTTRSNREQSNQSNQSNQSDNTDTITQGVKKVHITQKHRKTKRR